MCTLIFYASSCGTYGKAGRGLPFFHYQKIGKRSGSNPQPVTSFSKPRGATPATSPLQRPVKSTSSWPTLLRAVPLPSTTASLCAPWSRTSTSGKAPSGLKRSSFRPKTSPGITKPAATATRPILGRKSVSHRTLRKIESFTVYGHAF